MDIGSILVGLALLAVVAFVVAQPFLERRGERERQVTQADALIAEREQVLDALRDLDFDHAMGKITTDDYAPQRERLVQRGVALLQQLDALGVVPAPANGAAGAPEDEMERAIAARRLGGAGAPPAPGADDQIEAAIAARRQSSGAVRVAPPAQAATGPACPKCGTTAKADDRFCGRCGTALPVAQACAQCGQALQPGDRFCGRCGARVAEGAGAGAASA